MDYRTLGLKTDCYTLRINRSNTWTKGHSSLERAATH